MSTLQRIDVGARLSEAAIHNGTIYLAGQVPDDAIALEFKDVVLALAQ